MNYDEYWRKINTTNEELQSLLTSYWSKYSDWSTWQFWFLFASLTLPLILLCFTVDRKRIFELFFFGYTVHLLGTYINLVLGRDGYFTYKYFLIPQLPISLNITASIIPVGFLLLYQCYSNNIRKFFLSTLLLSALFSFVLDPIEGYLFHLGELKKGMKLYHFFIIDVGLAMIPYVFTRLLIKIRDGRKAG
ncbi:CBO0543 family protein [Priestia filamentosa]|uniref:CBO0543 family protein n=1 Tax=Priestia filamentosa TaxID=1402861 RepID=UPI000A086D06|nr:CBO0543 family protein [Priestia filamentosa]MDT3762987.1 CBO0543 family protein [Priestia filamentosa]OXS69508.1 hypothetical protein B1B01_11110 [Priestia filamentosa]WRU97430.1 CBO0543 family protein [Priestia filamentosa]SMF33409.1 hypothetical protein SAMN06296056_102794 [Priestia filamentosa]